MVCVPEPVDILRCGPAEWSEILRRGARAWNAWRDDYPWIIPDLTGIAPSVIECQLGPLTGGPINLANARLRGALLGRATLSEANLEGADLSDVDLTNARLDRANLSYANLRNANLDKADLAGARLMRADLGGANLAHARNLVQGQLFGTIGDASTLLPQHLERPATWPGATREVRERAAETAGNITSADAKLEIDELALERELEAATSPFVKREGAHIPVHAPAAFETRAERLYSRYSSRRQS